MMKHVSHVLIALCSVKSVLAQGGDDTRRLLSGRKTFNVKDFGAKGSRHDDTDAIQKAFDNLEKGCELKFGKGQFKFGPINFSGLKDVKINFEGAELFMGEKDMWTHRKLDGHTQWIVGDNCDGLEFTGGVFHGDRKSWKDTGKGKRPNSIHLEQMKDLEIHHLDILTAPAMHINVRSSHGFHVHDIKMDVGEEESSNTEGVSVCDSTDGHVQNVDVFDGDDCLKVHGTSSNILFEHCTCSGGHGLSIGGKEDEMHVKDIKFSNIKLYGMSDGARLKMNPHAEGFVKNITWEKLTMDNVRYPIHIQTDYTGGKSGNKMEIGDLYYNDIKATYSEKRLTGSGKGYPTKIGWITCNAKDCKKIHLKDIKIDVSGAGKYFEGWSCDGGHEQADVHNVSPDWPSSCHSHSGPSPGPKPSPSPSPSPSGDCQKEGESGRRRRCPSRRRSERQVEGWDPDAAEMVDDLLVAEEVVDEGDDEFGEGAEDVTPKEFTV